jgi:hypothetical protein
MPDEAPNSNDASNSNEPLEDQIILFLYFGKGQLAGTPPSTNVKNVRNRRFNPRQGPKYYFDYDYNYFEGKMAAGVLFKMQLNP